MAFEIDEYLRHQVQLARIETGGINAVVLPSLKETFLNIRRLLAVSDTIRNKAQLENIITRINQIVDQNGGWDVLEAEHLAPFAEFEAEWNADFTGSAIGEELRIPESAILAMATRESLLTVGQVTSTWSEFTKNNLDSRKQAYNSIVRRGFSRGLTIGQMTTEIKRVSEGMLRRQAEALARTGYIHYAAQADDAVAKENSDVLDEYYYVVSFDSRTTETCRSLATRYNPPSKRFKVGDKRAPVPPLHFNCRSRRIAVPKGTQPEGPRAAIGGKPGESEEFDRGTISAKMTHQTWLKQQPEWFVNDSLGPKRAELFLKGGLSLDKFTDMSLRPLTLDEIKDKYKKQWKKAFGDE